MPFQKGQLLLPWAICCRLGSPHRLDTGPYPVSWVSPLAHEPLVCVSPSVPEPGTSDYSQPRDIWPKWGGRALHSGGGRQHACYRRVRKSRIEIGGSEPGDLLSKRRNELLDSLRQRTWSHRRRKSWVSGFCDPAECQMSRGEISNPSRILLDDMVL